MEWVVAKDFSSTRSLNVALILGTLFVDISQLFPRQLPPYLILLGSIPPRPLKCPLPQTPLLRPGPLRTPQRAGPRRPQPTVLIHSGLPRPRKPRHPPPRGQIRLPLGGQLLPRGPPRQPLKNRPPKKLPRRPRPNPLPRLRRRRPPRPK